MRKIVSSETLDFDNLGVSENKQAVWRQAQARLYNVKNPYVGSKRQIIVDIATELDKNGVVYNSVFDLFSGSAVVSLFMKMIGKDVFSNDILTSSYFSALCFVENNSLTLTKDEIIFLCTNNNPAKSFFVRDTYGKRFTVEEAAFLDNYRANVETLIGRFEGRNAEIKKAIALVLIEHYVINYCFIGGRLNSGQVLAKLEHRLGHVRSGGDPNTQTMQFNLSPLPTFFESVEKTYCATNLDACEALKAFGRNVDLLYLDPPYGSSQSDYASMFAFCEEYIYEKPINKLSHLVNKDKFVKSKTYEEQLREMLSLCGFGKTWAISYSDSSFSDIDGITRIIKDYRKNITVVNMDHKYRYRDQSNSNITEYLIICR